MKDCDQICIVCGFIDAADDFTLNVRKVGTHVSEGPCGSDVVLDTIF